MRHRQRVGDQADGGRDRGELHIARGSGDAESHVQRAGACVEDQRDIQKIAFGEQAAAGLGCAQQRDDQQKSYRQSYQDQQRIAAGWGWWFPFARLVPGLTFFFLRPTSRRASWRGSRSLFRAFAQSEP